MADYPLSGVRVLEIGGGIAAGYASRALRGYGADVVRSEGPAGALTTDEEVYLVAGKRRVTADGAELRALALAADIVIEDRKPGASAEMGLDPAALRREKPALVVVSVTPFGQTGPYSGFEATNIVAHAMGGILSLTGSPELPPLVNGGSQAYYLAGANAVGAALTAYYGSLVHGEGDGVDISAQECAAGMLELVGPRTEHGQLPAHLRSGNHVSSVWGIYELADGFGGVCALGRQIPGLFKAVGDPELLEERFKDAIGRLENDDELKARMTAWFAGQTKADLLRMGTELKVPFGAVLTPADLLKNESLGERGFFDTVAIAGGGTATVPGRPFLGLPWRPPERLHEPGEDTGAVHREWIGVKA